VEDLEGGQAADDSKAHAHCVLDTEGYKHSLSENVILIACQHAKMLRYTYVHFLSYSV
jgi:hypothetical protein